MKLDQELRPSITTRMNCNPPNLKALGFVLLLGGTCHRASALELLSEDFEATNGGFVAASNGTSPVPAIYDQATGTWTFPGDNSGPSNNTLTSPPIPMPVTGGLRIHFDHRHSTEPIWDGVVLQFSVNDGPFVNVPRRAFTMNGYTIRLIGNHELVREEGFNYLSKGRDAGEFITSSAEFGAATAGDTVRVRFAGGWDLNTIGEGLNWELDRITLETLEDTDGDGMPDRYEQLYGLDETGDDGAEDPDSDGLGNLEEFLRSTNPRLADTDDDGLPDASEITTDPLLPDFTGNVPGLLTRANFNTGNGGYSPEAGGTTPVNAVYSSGTWRLPGDDSGHSFTSLTSPPITMPTTGALRLYLKHRYKFELLWDGGMIDYSVNGGPYRPVKPEQFSRNGYDTHVMLPSNALFDQPSFNRETEGYSARQFITTVAELGSAEKDDVIRIRFTGWWDSNTLAPSSSPNWEIDEVAVQLRHDSDGDGMANYLEFSNGLEPAVADADLDPDGDGISNLDELLGGTDPQAEDSDGDGLSDAVETNRGLYTDPGDTGTDPLVADTDQDGLPDSIEVLDTMTDPTVQDTDGDGFNDGYELEMGTNPRDLAETPALTPDLEWSAEHLPEGFVRTWPAELNRVSNDPAFFTQGYFGFVESGPANFRNISSWVHRPGFVFVGFGPPIAGRSWQAAFGDTITRQNATWEMVFRPGDYTGRHCLFNTGGNVDGMGIFLLDNILEFRFQDDNSDANRVVVATDLSLVGPPTDFFHVVAVSDVTSSTTGTGWLYVNGELVNGPITSTGFINDWSGGNRSELGIGFSVPGSDNFQPDHFLGDIAAFGFYQDRLLEADQIAIRFQRFAGAPPPIRIKEITHDVATNELTIAWESARGQLYNLRSAVDLSTGEPVSWPIHGDYRDIIATPPRNTLTIPRLDDRTRFFVIEAVPAPPEIVFSDDFESGSGAWTVGSDGAVGTTWELGSPSEVGPPSARSGNQCFATNLSSNYGLNANVWLRSPPIDLTTAEGATLRFFQSLDIEEGFDFGQISVLDATDDSLLALIEATVDGVLFDWGEVVKRLPPEAPGNVIKLEFRFQSDELENFPGWYVDDVELTVP